MRQVEWELERERNRERVGVSERERLHHISFSSPEGALLVNVASLLRKKQQKNKNKEKPEELKTSRASKN